MKNRSISLLCTAILLFTAGSGLTEEKKSAPLPTVAVQVRNAARTTTHPQVELVATIKPVEQAVIAAKVTGTITALPIFLGSRVKQGDLLVKISAEEISARLLQAQAQMAQAKRNLVREEKLLKKNASTPETVNSMRDMFAVARASLQGAQAMLGYTTITAPFSGVITDKFASSGDLATPGTPLLRLVDDSALQAVTAVPESLVRLLSIGTKLTVQVPSAKQTLTGKVGEIAPAADPDSRTTLVKINITDSQALRTGQFARVILAVDPADTLLIPQSAVIAFGQMNKVFVLENGTAQLRLVRIGSRTNEQVEILTGISPGDQVIIINNTLLVSGQPVTVTR